MFSKACEISGLGLIAWGLALYLSAPAGIIFAGCSLFFVGGVTDDAAVSAVLKRGWGWVQYAWYRQISKENGIHLPNLRRSPLPGLVRCECGGDEGCPLCMGTGFVPDSGYRENSQSPHPPIKVNPHTEESASRLARSREERSKLHDRTPALSRYEPSDHEVERLA